MNKIFETISFIKINFLTIRNKSVLPAEVLETVDCCEASSTTGFPSGPIEGGLVLLTEVLLPEWSPDSSGVLVGVIGCGVDVGGGMLFWGLLGIPGIPGPLGYIWVAPYPLILC